MLSEKNRLIELKKKYGYDKGVIRGNPYFNRLKHHVAIFCPANGVPVDKIEVSYDNRFNRVTIWGQDEIIGGGSGMYNSSMKFSCGTSVDLPVKPVGDVNDMIKYMVGGELYVVVIKIKPRGLYWFCPDFCLIN